MQPCVVICRCKTTEKFVPIQVGAEQQMKKETVPTNRASCSTSVQQISEENTTDYLEKESRKEKITTTTCHMMKTTDNSESQENRRKTGSSLAQYSTPVEQLQFHYSVNVADILHGCIDINLIDYINSLLRVQFNVTYGMVKPSVLYLKSISNEPLKDNEIIPRHVFAVQIHFINGHFIVSSQCGSYVTVYDSLPNVYRTKHILPQLKLIYASVSDLTNVKYILPQNQGASTDCGVFAVNNAFMLLKGLFPQHYEVQQSSLRTHLHACILQGYISDFPRKVFASTPE